MPLPPSLYKTLIFRILNILIFIKLGLFLSFTRVGVGAHYPLDVIVGSILGFLSAIIGVLINRKFPIWSWISHRRCCPFFIILFVCCIGILVKKLTEHHLPIYYLSLVSLVFTSFLMFKKYVQKNHA